MDTLIIFGIAIGLAMDAFAVSLVCGASVETVTARRVFRLAFHFGLFQALMPVIGWAAGRSVQYYIESWDHWIAFGLLMIVGAQILYKSLTEDNGRFTRIDPTRGISLFLLSVATSADALAAGLSMAMIGVTIWHAAMIIGLTTAVLTVIGMYIGSRVGRFFRKSFEFAGGIILIGIGIKILFMHNVFN